MIWFEIIIHLRHSKIRWGNNKSFHEDNGILQYNAFIKAVRDAR